MRQSKPWWEAASFSWSPSRPLRRASSSCRVPTLLLEAARSRPVRVRGPSSAWAARSTAACSTCSLGEPPIAPEVVGPGLVERWVGPAGTEAPGEMFVRRACPPAPELLVSPPAPPGPRGPARSPRSCSACAALFCEAVTPHPASERDDRSRHRRERKSGADRSRNRRRSSLRRWPGWRCAEREARGGGREVAPRSAPGARSFTSGPLTGLSSTSPMANTAGVRTTSAREVSKPAKLPATPRMTTRRRRPRPQPGGRSCAACGRKGEAPAAGGAR